MKDIYTLIELNEDYMLGEAEVSTFFTELEAKTAFTDAVKNTNGYRGSQVVLWHNGNLDESYYAPSSSC